MATAEILFVSSTPDEFRGVLRFWQDVRPVSLPVHWARTAIRKGQPVLAIANGAGWERARLAAEAAPYRQLCNIGFCGALDPALAIADIVTSNRHLPISSALPHRDGAIFSSPRVVGTSSEKHLIYKQGYLAVEMESAGFGIRPLYCVKAVSDLADETFANDFNAAILPDGRISKPRIVAQALRDPLRRFPELLRFGRHTARAARTLGEFVDACTF